MSDLLKLAADFESKLDLPSELFGPESPPVSHPPVSKQPISIQPHKDLPGTVKSDLHKFNRFVMASLLEATQKELSLALAQSLKRHGYDIDPIDLQRQILKFGDYSEAETKFAESFQHSLNQYTDKLVHYIINNLSW